MTKLATWNVNSINVRLEQVLAWMDDANADVLALQETKVVDEQFPIDAFTDKGYHVAFSGQKTYNGVAVISRTPIENPLTDMPGFEDPQRRILAVDVAGIRLVNLYVPNGRAVDSDPYAYKLDWLTHVTQLIKTTLSEYSDVAVVGDFNIAPADIDVHDPAAWAGHVLVSPAEREAFQGLLSLGLTDSFRTLYPEEKIFSWWDYRAAAFRRNHGLRIDHVLVSEPLKAKLTDCGIDKEPRKHDRPSDHTPVWLEF